MAKYLFSNYLLDVDERRLLRDNEEIRLRGKLFDTLRVLVENAGKLVREDAFMESVWPDSVVEDGQRHRLDPGDCGGVIPCTRESSIRSGRKSESAARLPASSRFALGHFAAGCSRCDGIVGGAAAVCSVPSG
jgi:hypothetical protein